MSNEQLTQLIDLLDIMRKEKRTEFYHLLKRFSEDESSVYTIKDVVNQWIELSETVSTIRERARSMRGDFCKPV